MVDEWYKSNIEILYDANSPHHQKNSAIYNFRKMKELFVS